MDETLLIILTNNVKYEIVGKLCDTTNLKATAVKRRVRVTLNRSEGEDISTENEQNDRISIRRLKKKEIKIIGFKMTLSQTNMAVDYSLALPSWLI